MMLSGTKTSKLKILINSCWAFSDMWRNINSLYGKYWKNHPELIILTDKNENSKEIANTLAIDGEMSSKLLEALDQVNSEYIFFSFDDYYPCHEVNVDLINSLIKTMDDNHFDYCRFYKLTKVRGKKLGFEKYQILPLKKTYEVNFYPSIWKVESLKKVLKENEEIWKAEARITRRARENSLKCITVNPRKVFRFVDIVRKGKYLRSGYRYIVKNGLHLSSRPKRTIKETISLNTRIFISNHSPVCLKNALKKIMHKRGKIYYSDFENTDD